MRNILIAVVLMTGLTACSPRTQPRSPSEPLAKTLNQGEGEQNLVRYEDQELGVVCYRVRNYEGLSCIKKDLTTKDQ